MALDSMDNLRDNLINKGIGNSGLTSQAVGRMNIEELSNLNGALQTSRQTMLNEKQARDSQVLSQVLKDRSLLRPTGGSSGGNFASLDPRKTTILISDGSANGANAGNTASPRVTLNIPGRTQTPIFSSIEEAVAYVESQGLKDNTNLVVEGLPENLDNTRLDRLQSMGVALLPQSISRSLRGQSDRSNNINFGGRSPQKDTALQESGVSKQMKYLQTSPEKFSISELPQNERAKVVSGVMDKVAYYGSPTSPNKTAEGSQRYEFLKEAMNQGKLNQVVEALLKKGVVSYGK